MKPVAAIVFIPAILMSISSRTISSQKIITDMDQLIFMKLKGTSRIAAKYSPLSRISSSPSS